MLVLFLFVAFLSIWFIAPWGEFPLNDDWVYARNVVDSLAAGRFVISTGQYAYAIPQLLLGMLTLKSGEEPFLKLRWIGILSGMAAVPVLIRLCQKAINQNSSALFFLSAIATFFFIPYFQPSISFMTDAPAFLLWVLGLWSVSLFLEKSNFSSWLLAFITITIAVSERQLAIFIPFSIVVAQNLDFRPKQGFEGVARVFKKSYPVMLFIFPLFLIQWWWGQLSPVKVPDSSFSPNPGVLIRISRQLIYLGWTCIPFLFVPLKPLLVGQSKRAFKVSLYVFGLGALLHVINSIFFRSHLLPPFYGNVLDKVGILPILLSGNPEIIFPVYFQFVLLVMGLLGSIRILWGFSILWNNPDKSRYSEVILWSSLTYFIFMCFRATQFDRYFIPVLPLSLLCLLKTCSTDKLTAPRLLGTITSCLFYIAFSTTIVSDFFRWNEARREAYEFAISKGLRPGEVCAGYEYLGWYKVDSKQCTHTVSFSELPDATVEKTFPYPSIWGSHNRNLFLLRKGNL